MCTSHGSERRWCVGAGLFLYLRSADGCAGLLLAQTQTPGCQRHGNLSGGRTQPEGGGQRFYHVGWVPCCPDLGICCTATTATVTVLVFQYIFDHFCNFMSSCVSVLRSLSLSVSVPNFVHFMAAVFKLGLLRGQGCAGQGSVPGSSLLAGVAFSEWDLKLKRKLYCRDFSPSTYSQEQAVLIKSFYFCFSFGSFWFFNFSV